MEQPVAQRPSEPGRQTSDSRNDIGRQSEEHRNGSSRNHSRPSGGTTSSKPAKVCQKCGEPLNGQFVRALGGTFHLNCFRCEDCNDIVASKFFPVTLENGKQVPLCEIDYFRRLDLLCHNCGGALRGSYVTALDKKYHIEHFTCSVCPTAFGPDDNYYEYEGEVYCHYHYSERFAQRCNGCETAILKQFVEIFRNGQNQHWHPECYMIHKFWNVRLAMPDEKVVFPKDDSEDVTEEQRAYVKNKEEHMEEKTYRIWSILSAFEETSASCISDMLLHVSNGATVEGVIIAKRFIDHVDVLFVAVDHLDATVQADGMPSIQYGREAKLLCKRVVSFFNLLSKAHDRGSKKLGVTQELLSLVTGLAHYLKLLIRISLQAALKLERENGSEKGLSGFLNNIGSPDAMKNISFSLEDPASVLMMADKVADQCVACGEYVDDECYRIGVLRWHARHFECSQCHKSVAEQGKLAEAMYHREKGRLLCAQDAQLEKDRKDYIVGAKRISRLQQYVHLLHVALARLLSVLKSSGSLPHTADDPNMKLQDSQSGQRAPTSAGLLAPGQLNAEARSKSFSGQTANQQEGSTYEDTVDELTRLRSLRLNPRLSTTGRKARHSRLIEDYDASNESGRSQDANGRSYRIEEDREDPGKQQRSMSLGTGLTLDDIPRIVAAEQAKEQRPNAYRHAGASLLPSQKPAKLRDGPGLDVNDSSKGQTNGANLNVDRPKKYFSELSPIEYFIVRHVAVLQMQPLLAPQYSLEDLLNLIESRSKPTFWNKVFKNDKNKNKKKKGIFGVPLETLNERDGAESTEGISPGALRVPAILDDAVTAMKQMDMSVEGVFRKNGNIKGLRELAERFDAKDSDIDLSIETPVQVAALLKKFLRELPEPLLTYKLHDLFTESQKITDQRERQRLVHLIMCLLPKAHRDACEVLFTFLMWCASFSSDEDGNGSKMDAHNLATVMSPNVLRPVEDNSKAPGVDESFQGIEAVYQLIEFNEEMCKVPADVSEMLLDSDLTKSGTELTSKEILKRYGALVSKPVTSEPAPNQQMAMSAQEVNPAVGRDSSAPFIANTENEFAPPQRIPYHHSNASAGSTGSFGRGPLPSKFNAAART